MPLVGLGTYLLKDKDLIENAVANAGYRHIDTAYFYATEEIIGEALKEVFSSTDIKREEMWITTKLWEKDYSEPERGLKESLQKLQLEYVDLYLIHFPNNYFGGKIPMHVIW